MNDKNSFLLFKDLLEPVDDLSNEDAGMLLKAILHHQNGGDIPELSAAANVAFKFTKQQLDRSSEHYEMMGPEIRSPSANSAPSRPNRTGRNSGPSGGGSNWI